MCAPDKGSMSGELSRAPDCAGVLISACVPLAGQGLVARSGDLIVMTDGLAADPDPLLAVLAEVAAAGGDGSALVRSAARAALACEDQPSWACAGVTRDGELAVLVHGAAAADIRVDDGSAVILTGRSSLLPVSQLLAGGTVIATITLSGPTDADPRLRLDSGIVRGGGATITVTAGTTSLPGAAAGPSAPPTATASPSGPTAATADLSPPPPATTDMSGALTVVADPGRPPTLLADPSRPLTMLADPSTTLADSVTGAREPVPPGSGGDADVEGPAPVLVEGVLCARQHFNDPNVRYCRQCGLAIAQLAGNVQLGPRPPLGVLLLDDGTGFALDADYVLGREPLLDEDVAAGRARPLRISDPDGTVSRLHLRVSLVGWQVEVSDLGSANGSVLQPVTGPEARLKPHDPVIIEPGSRVAVGRRSFQYLSHRGN
jgi:FHA domain